MNDIQTKNILSKANDLNLILSDKLASKVLEIDLGAESAQRKDFLNRVIRSLEQYVNKKKDLVYIGLIGHFSSGKSSTINSLLSIHGTEKKRETDLNPTDKVITLMTHEDNSSSLIMMTREGTAVPVRSVHMTLEILKNIVLCDTPGSGDPQVVNEMIQDFLPICDLVFYCISAANPIDQADLPLLTQKNEKLEFVPLKYIITRTDEFRIDRSTAVADKNIDNAKRDKFLGQLISRLKEVAKAKNISAEDFIFIDNEVGYNIDSLKNIMLTQGDLLNQDTLVQIHSHKIEYYRSQLDTIYEYYLGLIGDKIQQSTSFVKTAEENITRFNKVIEINNEKLRDLWRKGETSFRDALHNEDRGIDDLKVEVFSSLVNEKKVFAARKALFSAAENVSSGYVGMVAAEVKHLLRDKLKDIKNDITRNLENGAVDGESISHLFKGRIKLDVDYSETEVDFARINEEMKTLYDTIFVVLNDFRSDLRHRLNQVKYHTGKEYLLKALLKNYEEGKQVISGNFDQYFEMIQLYRGTVLTRNTKETIQKLRIGTELDVLDGDFEEDFVNKEKSRASGGIYTISEDEIQKFKSVAENFNVKASSVRGTLESMSIKRNEIPGTLMKERVNVEDIVRIVIEKKELAVNNIYSENLNLALDDHDKAFEDYSARTISLVKLRRKKIRKWMIGLGAALPFFYFLGHYFNWVPDQTLGFTVLIGICLGLAGNLIGYFFGTFRNDLKKMFGEKKTDFVHGRRQALLQTFSESFWDELINTVLEEKTIINSTSLRDKFSAKITPIVATVLETEQAILDSLAGVGRGWNASVDEHRRYVVNFFNIHNPIFLDADNNTKVISEITQNIKSISIKPSFDLLEDTTNSLQEVKSKILKVKDSKRL